MDEMRRRNSDKYPKGEGITQGQFFERMEMLEERMQDYHRKSREHVDRQVEKILEAFSAHEVIDRDVADRVLTIETERGIEKTAASKHGAIAGSIVAGLIVGLAEAIKRLMGAHS